ncbi:MAG TPA: hypothetical protein ENN80_07365 [Candidatus Hydrogenedentes bacterium]|nr:hypothetical protein [Candidatus Hydrogenedentota bacterium]
MTVLLALLSVAVGAAYDNASLEELKQAAEKSQHTYDIETARELLPVLQGRLYTVPQAEETALRELLAQHALFIASMARNEYEKDDISIGEKRELGSEIDAAASKGFSALGPLPETSEKHRITADLLMMRMRTKFKGQRHEGSMEAAADKALALDPCNPSALLTKSRRKLFAEDKHGGDFEEGLAMVNRAIELDPANEQAFVLRGLAWKRHGDMEKAIADWKRALDINPHTKPAREHLERAGAN